jgi:mRNA interferase RelE/StbE
MRYAIEFRASARNAMRKLPAAVLARLGPKIDSLADNPRPPDCVKLAGQENLYRVRVGDYRIVYQIQDARLIVVVILVAHRRDVYRGL